MTENGKEEKVGGIAFYLSFLSFFLLAASNLYNVFRLSLTEDAGQRWLVFGLGIGLGLFFAALFIKGRLSVFLHELRHAVLSNLVGNKWKALVVNERSGHFEYAYSEKTARFNAFVSLAPYWLPLFLIIAGGASIAALYRHQTLHLPMLVSFFYGIDLALNFRDISPIQSDFTNIKGGFLFAVAYVLAVNIFIFTLMASWISGGLEGLKFMFLEPWYFMLSLYHYPG